MSASNTITLDRPVEKTPDNRLVDLSWGKDPSSAKGPSLGNDGNTQTTVQQLGDLASIAQITGQTGPYAFGEETSPAKGLSPESDGNAKTVKQLGDLASIAQITRQAGPYAFDEGTSPTQQVQTAHAQGIVQQAYLGNIKVQNITKAQWDALSADDKGLVSSYAKGNHQEVRFDDDDDDDPDGKKHHLMRLSEAAVVEEEAFKFPRLRRRRIARPKMLRRGSEDEKPKDEKSEKERAKDNKSGDGNERTGENNPDQDRAARAEVGTEDAAAARDARAVARGGEELKAATSLGDAAEIVRGVRVGRSALRLAGLATGVVVGTVASVALGTVIGGVVVTGAIALAAGGIIYGAEKYLGRSNEQAAKGAAGGTYKVIVDKETEEVTAKAKAAFNKGDYVTAAKQGSYAFAQVTGLVDLAKLVGYVAQHPIQSAEKVAKGAEWTYDHSSEIAEGAMFIAKHPVQAADTTAHAVVAFAGGNKSVASTTLAAAQNNGLAGAVMSEAQRMQQLKNQTSQMPNSNKIGLDIPRPGIGAPTRQNKDNLG